MGRFVIHAESKIQLVSTNIILNKRQEKVNSLSSWDALLSLEENSKDFLGSGTCSTHPTVLRQAFSSRLSAVPSARFLFQKPPDMD